MGCGTGLDDGIAGRVLFVNECPGQRSDAAETTDVVVLDWDGGTSPIYPGYEFDGLDLSLFRTGKRSSLAQEAELFKELVRQEIVSIYCDVLEVSIHVRNGPFDTQAEVTTVLLTQALQPDEGADIGEGEYDPCNRQHDNAALVFGEQIRLLAGTNTLEEWVSIFANLCAHEIGHTLGYGHVERDPQAQAERPLYVELMLGGHTMEEMRRPQRIFMDQTNCPVDLEARASRPVRANSLP